MSTKLFQYFVKGLTEVTKEMADIDVKLEGAVSTESEVMVLYGVTTVINFTGKINGRILLDMEPGVALIIAQNVTQTAFDTVRDTMVLATISELNNILSGRAIAPINNEMGLNLWMSPPYVFTAKDSVICIPKLQSATLNCSTKYGKLRLNIAFEKEV